MIAGKQVTQDQVAAILQLRRKRSEVFGHGLFSDPAWDILLELFEAELAGRKTSLHDLSSIAPESTLARWVAALEERRLVVCRLDPLRPGRFQIALTTECATKLSVFLTDAPLLARLH